MTTKMVVIDLRALVTKDISDSDIEAVISPPPEEKPKSYEDIYLAAFGLTK